MRILLKIVASILFFLFWGQLSFGCQKGMLAAGGAGGYQMAKIFNLIMLIGGIYGIWKFNSSEKSDKDDDITLKKD